MKYWGNNFYASKPPNPQKDSTCTTRFFPNPKTLVLGQNHEGLFNIILPRPLRPQKQLRHNPLGLYMGKNS